MKKKKQLSREKRTVLQKISEYEKLGGEYFFKDVENDPPYQTLTPDKVDYLHKTRKFKINGFFAGITESLCKIFFKKKFKIKIFGEENLKPLNGGAIFTANHFSTTENLAVKLATEKAGKSHRFYKIIREGNYFMKGIIGWLLKYADTLPLSSSISTMKLLDKAIAEILKNSDFILIYPEQAMWWNYQKPRPYRIGAFKYAAKNNVPVVPIFTTLHKKNKNSELLPNNIRYEVHILPLIYPEKDLSVRENAEIMRKKNFEYCKEVYETVYKKELLYK